MPKRTQTQYTGVKYRTARRIGTAGTEKVYYIIYKKDGRLYEEKVGREHSDSMTPSKAAKIRLQKIDGRLQPKRETLMHKKAAKLQLYRLRDDLQRTSNPRIALQAFCHAHGSRLPLPNSIVTYLADRIALYINGNANSLDQALGLKGQPAKQRIPGDNRKQPEFDKKTNNGIIKKTHHIERKKEDK